MRPSVLALAFAASVFAAQSTPAISQRDIESRFAAARSLLGAGKAADAAKAFEQITHAQPAFAEAHFALGISYLQLKRPAEAAAALRAYLKLKPESSDGHAVLGILLFDGGRLSEARPELEKAVRLDHSQIEAAKTLGRVYNLQGDPARAIALLSPIVSSSAGDDDCRIILAHSFLGKGEPAAAGRLLDEMLAANPRNPLQAYVLAAMAARDTHDLPKALEICERGQKLYPNTEQLESVAVSIPEAALIARTVEHIEQIKKNPRNVDQLIAVGRVMMAADKGKRSVALQLSGTLLERAVQLDPGNATARYHYGRYLVAQMKPEEANAAFQNAMSCAGDDELRVLILGWTGFVETRLNHFDAAAEAFQRSLELNRKLNRHIAESAFLYYKFLVSRERDAESQALLAEVLQWEPFFAPALLERAKMYLAGDQPAKAAEAALLVTRNTEDPGILHTAHYLLVKICTAMGNQQQAQAHAEWIKSH